MDYSKPRSQFPNVIAPYKPGYVPPPNLSNTDRIQQLMHDGKIMLSMDDAVALALENNLDLVLARYNLNIADTDILASQVGREHSWREHGDRPKYARRRRGRPQRERWARVPEAQA